MPTASTPPPPQAATAKRAQRLRTSIKWLFPNASSNVAACGGGGGAILRSRKEKYSTHEYIIKTRLDFSYTTRIKLNKKLNKFKWFCFCGLGSFLYFLLKLAK